MRTIYGFEREPYTRELDATILQVVEEDERCVATLDDTILYPEGGGQPFDLGTVNGVAVLGVEKGSGELLHVLEKLVEPGPARVVLDWDRRYDHMQQHTAQHVLTRTTLDQFGWATRSFHIGDRVSDIELDCKPPEDSVIEAMEDAVAHVIMQDRPIRCYRVSAEEFSRMDVRSRGLPAGHAGDVRLVEIRGFDLNTCGGTHLKSTAEVEMLKVVSSEPLRGGCRLSWVAGKRVRRRLAAHEQRSREMRGLLDVGDEELLSSLRLKLEQLTVERRARRTVEGRLAEAMADELLARDQAFVELHWEFDETRRIAKTQIHRLVELVAHIIHDKIVSDTELKAMMVDSREWIFPILQFIDDDDDKKPWRCPICLLAELPDH